MILAAGATLQSGKYVIQAVLHQTDLGMTYQAHHVYLDQTVVLQTLNPAGNIGGQRSNFAQLRQQFMEAARQLAKYPSNHRLRAIDLFEEKVEGQDLPFVVLSFLANQPPQKLGEWFATLPEPTLTGSTQKDSAAAPSALPSPSSQSLEPLKKAERKAEPETAKQASFTSATEPQPSEPMTQQTASADKPIADKPSGDKLSGDNLLAANGTPASPASARSPAETSTAAAKPSPTALVGAIDSQTQLQNRNGHSVRILVQPQRRSLNWFLLTALVAGAMGAGAGFALRVQPTPQGKAPFNLGTHLFTREQSFPAQGNWPIHETPESIMPEPAASQPAYSAEPALRYTPPIESFPSGSYAPLPADPIQSAPQTSTPDSAIQNQPAGIPPETSSSTNAPPVTAPAPVRREAAPSAKPAPLAPAPAAPAPVIDPPAAPAPPPVVDSAPIAPAPAPAATRPPGPRGIDQ